MKCPLTRHSYGDRKQPGGCQGLGEGAFGGVEFLPGVTTVFWNEGEWLQVLVNILKCTELHISKCSKW